MTKHLSTSEEIKNINFVVFDLETTGGNHQSDKIIEIGLVKIENLKMTEEKSFLINPEIKIPDFIQKLTSIRQKDVGGSPLIEDVIDEILEFIGDNVLVAHNTSFDVPFLNSVLRRLGKEELKNPNICTNLMTKYLIPNLLNSNLNYMSRIFNIKHKKAHRALDDARATAELIIKYLRIFIKKDIQKLNHLYYPRNRYELDSCHFRDNNEANKEKIIDEIQNLKTPALVTLKGEHGIILCSLPCVGHQDEVEFIKSKVHEQQWQVATIKFYGPFLEAFVHFSSLYSKVTPQIKQEIVKVLWAVHLAGEKAPAKASKQVESMENIVQELGDFAIIGHLVPEQLIIFPLFSLNVKNQLIFRYPSHQKKLLQYINSKSQRISAGKLKKTYFQAPLEVFLSKYLLKQSEQNHIFFFKKKKPHSDIDAFTKELEEFFSKKENQFNYPKDFV